MQRMAILTVAVTMLVAAPARAIDIDHDGYHDALIRQVGDRCTIGYVADTRSYRGRLTVRPPRVWALKAWGRQRVDWRAAFFDRRTNRYVAYGNWVYAFLSPGEHTRFNGGPDAPTVAIGDDAYWGAGEYYEHDADDGQRIAANVQVGWRNPATKRWTTVTLGIVNTGVFIDGTMTSTHGADC